MAPSRLPRRVALDVHDEAIVCPVLQDAPQALLEQMQAAGCELLPRDNGDIVIYTPPTGSSGYTVSSFFQRFPELVAVLDLDSVEEYGAFLDEESQEELRALIEDGPEQRQHQAHAHDPRQAAMSSHASSHGERAAMSSHGERGFSSEREGRPGSMNSKTSGQTALGMAELDALEETFSIMKHNLHKSASRAEKAISTKQHEFKDVAKQLQEERQQIAEERAKLDVDREELIEKERRLLQELEEVERLRSEIEESQAGKKGFLWC